MVKLNKIYTKTGDKGTTSLVSGKRVAKDHYRVRAYGTVDELNSILGIVRVKASIKIKKIISNIQNDLFDLGADLCVPGKNRKKTSLRVAEQQVVRLEQEIDHLNKGLQPLSSFILPGGAPASAYLHLARTVVRRAERIICDLVGQEKMSLHLRAYINRLSDHLFVAARYLNNHGQSDVLWEPGKNQ